ncbi:MAG TPA: hypothetical protein VFB38_21070 [Chthonomonadaceae bacterium]|nr:hypothetical protein [Chthonomonadaceae bacterium]
MAQFQFEDTGANTVIVDMVFNANPFGKNSWSTASGDTSLLGVSEGHWESSGLQNRVILRSLADSELAFLDINVAASLTDPFEPCHVGDSGDGLLLSGSGIVWTLLSK